MDDNFKIVFLSSARVHFESKKKSYEARESKGIGFTFCKYMLRKIDKYEQEIEDAENARISQLQNNQGLAAFLNSYKFFYPQIEYRKVVNGDDFQKEIIERAEPQEDNAVSLSSEASSSSTSIASSSSSEKSQDNKNVFGLIIDEYMSVYEVQDVGFVMVERDEFE